MIKAIGKGLAVIGILTFSSGLAFSQVKKLPDDEEKSKELPPYIAQVSVDKLNIRIKPTSDESSTIVGILKSGDKIGVVDESNSFLKILPYPPKTMKVWVLANSIKKEGNEGDGIATRKGIKVYSDARITADVLGEIVKDEKVKIIKEYVGWYQIEAPQSCRFFVAKKFVEFSEKVKDEDELWAKLGVKTVKSEKIPPSQKEPPTKEKEEILAKLNLADEVIKNENTKLDKGDIENIDYTPAITALGFVVSNANLQSTKEEAKIKLRYIEPVQKVIVSLKAKSVSIEKAMEEFRKLFASQKEPKSFVAQGQLESVGAILKGRPGTHKLISGGKIVCFLKPKDKAIEECLDGLITEYVGVTGEVKIDESATWKGYKVITVDSVKKLMP